MFQNSRQRLKCFSQFWARDPVRQKFWDVIIMVKRPKMPVEASGSPYICIINMLLCLTFTVIIDKLGLRICTLRNILYPYTGKKFSAILLNIFILLYGFIFLPTKWSQRKKKCNSDMFCNTIHALLTSPHRDFLVTIINR